jgi:hypothetical protein
MITGTQRCKLQLAVSEAADLFFGPLYTECRRLSNSISIQIIDECKGDDFVVHVTAQVCEEGGRLPSGRLFQRFRYLKVSFRFSLKQEGVKELDCEKADSVFHASWSEAFQSFRTEVLEYMGHIVPQPV